MQHAISNVIGTRLMLYSEERCVLCLCYHYCMHVSIRVYHIIIHMSFKGQVASRDVQKMVAC